MIETLYPKEIWRQFRDTRYDISNLGRVRSTLRPDASGNVRRNQAGIMAQKLTAAGYNQVQIAGTWRNVHRMVAEVFIGLPNSADKMVVDHINNIKTDNRLTNLQWLTPSENVQKALKDGRVPEQSEEHKAKSRKRFLEINEGHKKPVEMIFPKLDDAKVFDSAIEASAYIGKHPGYVSEMLSEKKCHGHFGQNRKDNPDYIVKYISKEEYEERKRGNNYDSIGRN